MDVPSRLTLRELAERIREDYRVNDRSWSRPGFHALVVHRFGTWALGLPRVLRWPANLVYEMCFAFLRNVYGIELPRSTTVGRRLRISHHMGIVVHPRAVIGDDCIIRQNVTIGAISLQRTAAPRLGSRVQVGAGAVIVGKLIVGDGAHIGPNAVVTVSVPAGAMAVVSPPRVVQPPRIHRVVERVVAD